MNKEIIKSSLFVVLAITLSLGLLFVALDTGSTPAGSIDIKSPKQDLNTNVWGDESQFQATVHPTDVNATISIKNRHMSYNQKTAKGYTPISETHNTIKRGTVSISGGIGAATMHKAGNNINPSNINLSSSGLIALNIPRHRIGEGNQFAEEDIMIETGTHNLVDEGSNPDPPVAPLDNDLIMLLIFCGIWISIKKIKK